MIGSCPGAVHLRTDTERKWLSKATALSVAPQPSYTPADRSAVYERIFARTAKLLQAGRPVVVDATFLDEAQRTALQDLAMRSCVGFLGLWLSAPLSVLIKRVNTRAGDASQANARVVAVQYSALTTPETTGSWVNLDSSSTPDATRAAAMAALKTRFGTTVSVR
jgi:predicted kinase